MQRAFCKVITLGVFFCITSIFGEIPYIEKVADIEALIPSKAEDIQREKERAIQSFKEGISDLLKLKKEERSFDNTLKTWDSLVGTLQVFQGFCGGMSLVHPNGLIREACDQAQSDIQVAFTDAISASPDLYEAIKIVKEKEDILPLQKAYYLEETLDFFKQSGCHLSEEKRKEVGELTNQITDLGLVFEKNIREDRKSLWVRKQDLSGLEEDFIESLDKNEKGEYQLTLDYPVYFPVMSHCSNPQIRKDLNKLFNNRAYPANESVLQAIIAKRNQLANLLGFTSFSEYDLSFQMAKNIDTAEMFLSSLYKGSIVKANQEFQSMTEKLPESVVLTSDGRLHSYDAAFVSDHYKKEKFSVDEVKISEYFPSDKVIQGLLSIYEAFFDLKIEILPASLWDKEVKLLQITKARSKDVLGYLILDLFPRDNKFTHACECTLIPSYTSLNKKYPALSLVVANFPKKTTTKPSLLTHDQVKTFFHEFGHAIHDILGRGELILQCGTRVKMDFVELPSQLLEEWVWDAAILKKISSHYLTGEALPDVYIDQMLKAKNCASGQWLQRQCFLSVLALDCFKAGSPKNIEDILREKRESMLSQYAYDETDRFYVSFGHLNGYGAKYYGYLWSRVFAADVFVKIKKEGLLNPKAGAFYIDTIIGKGGAQDPNEMLRNFLGREPSEQPFIQNFGI